MRHEAEDETETDEFGIERVECRGASRHATHHRKARTNDANPTITMSCFDSDPADVARTEPPGTKSPTDLDDLRPPLVPPAIAEDVARIAAAPVRTILIVGETGSGKQLVARVLHDESPRHPQPFVQLNCSALPNTLVESELFGYEPGAFSGAQQRKLGLVEVAHRGTLFLDEIGELAVPTQAKLLTFLESQSFRRLGATTPLHVDIRIIAATNRDLASLVADGRFRSDLWFRLSAIVLQLPPLRARVGEIEGFARWFLHEASARFGRSWRGLSAPAVAALESHHWPGNLRELRAVIQNAALMFDGEELDTAHLPPLTPGPAGPAGSAAPDAPATTRPTTRIDTLSEIVNAHIRRVLVLSNGNISLAARRLGITRQTLRRKIRGGSG